MAAVLVPEVELFIICVVILLALVGAIGNITVLFVLRSNERRNGRKVPSNVFIRNLALTDMLIGLLILPVMLVSLTYHRSWVLSDYGCQLHGIMIAVLVNVSILSLTGIAIDRYLAVVQPIYYKVILTKQRARAMVTVFWILSVVIALLPFGCGIRYDYVISASLCLTKAGGSSGVIYLLVTTIVTIVIPFIILTYCYIRIYTEFKVRSVQRQLYNRAKRLSIQVLEWGQAHMTLHQSPSRMDHIKGGSTGPVEVVAGPGNKDPGNKDLQTVVEETTNSVSSHASSVYDVTNNVCILNKSAVLVNSADNTSSNESDLFHSRLNSVRLRKAEAVNDFKTAVQRMFSRKARARGTPKCMRNASVTARLIIVCFLLCWTPYICKTVYILVVGSEGREGRLEGRWFMYIHITVVTIVLSNCAWNPLIYLSRSATYKKEIAKILFFRLNNKATPKADSNYAIPITPAQRFHRKLSIIAGIEPIPATIRKPSNNMESIKLTDS